MGREINSIRDLFCNFEICVPNYQRAYSWETPKGSGETKHTDVFLQDLEEFVAGSQSAKYFFGHLIFQKISDRKVAVVDGQQRLTTIIIFLSCIYEKLKSLRSLSEEEETIYEDIIKRKQSYKFETVSDDNHFFKGYVIDRTIKERNGIETQSARRIADACDYFMNVLAKEPEEYLCDMLKIVTNAFCSTYFIEEEAEAARMFLFQNDRGKKPTNLEKLKALFISHIYISADESKRKAMFDDIRESFEKIYRSISKIEVYVNEDDLLRYTTQIYFNSLWQSDSFGKVKEGLRQKESALDYISGFTLALERNFVTLERFFSLQEQTHIQIHSFIALGNYSFALPFIIKAYRFNLSASDVCALAAAFESISLRNIVTRTRANITSRINGVFEGFTEKSTDIGHILKRIDTLKADANSWDNYWSNTRLEIALQGWVNNKVARFILWKYENYLKSKGHNGYPLIRYDEIENPTLEHIAPQNENKSENSGYCKYDDEFRNKYLYCLGNCLLLTRRHNSSISNDTLAEKLKTYNYLEQHREIQEMTKDDGLWDKQKIDARKKELIDFVLNNY
jgi:hypothetical protein